MIMKGSSLKGSGLIVIFLLTLFLLQPVLVDAQFDKEGLESLITRTNKRRDTAEKVAVFKGIMANHYYISASVVDEILKDLPPGEALAAVVVENAVDDALDFHPAEHRQPAGGYQVGPDPKRWGRPGLQEDVGCPCADCVLEDIVQQHFACAPGRQAACEVSSGWPAPPQLGFLRRRRRSAGLCRCLY